MTGKIRSAYVVLLCFSLGVTVRGTSTDTCNAADGNRAWMEDGACDPQNLIAECDWDGGDCCRCTCVDNDFFCGTDGYLCVKPAVFDDNLTTCKEVTPPLCPEDIQTNWVVKNTTQVQILAEAMNCSSGTFEVEWIGSIVVDTEIVVTSGTVLKITGSVGSSAVLDGGGNTRLLRVVNASLQLNDVVVRDGNATFGGAITAIESTVILNRTSFIGNTATKKNGGAMFVYGGSNVSFSGKTDFLNNTSGYDGGALYVVNSRVSWNSVSNFSRNNAAHSGGALCAVAGSTVSWDAETTFIDNSARSYSGGALSLEGGSSASWSGDASFSNNIAQYKGGAIYVNLGSNVSWSKAAFFTGNIATFGEGGAISTAVSSTVTLGGETQFRGNSCGMQGGALLFKSLTSSTAATAFGSHESFLVINGNIRFINNKCKSNGGGLAVLNGLDVSFGNASITFSGNTADVAGGGVYISASGMGSMFTNATFRSNSAEIGGGVFITGSATSMDDEPSATFEGCRFIENKAEATGGAIESVTGTVTITNTSFKGNKAGVGGALRVAGATSLDGCIFEDNVSDIDGGQAISMKGYELDIEDCEFRGNAYNCDPGMFLNESGVGDRFNAICSGCYGCSSCTVEKCMNVSTCSVAIDHSFSPGGYNATLMTLEIEAGYWRTTNESVNVLPCYNADACNGGLTASRDFCRKGYRGPSTLVIHSFTVFCAPQPFVIFGCEDCAVCNDNYVKGPGFTCTKCSIDVWGVRAAVICAVVAVVAVVMVSAVIKYVISAETGAGRCIVARVLHRVPLQSVKIVIVAWQILTQLTEAENIVYPEYYKSFLDVLNFLNIELWVLSAGCMTYVDFHIRFMAVVIGPIVAMLMLGGTYFFAVHRHNTSDETVKIIRQKHMSVALFILFFVYTSTSSVIIPMFDCDTLDDGNVYLRADYTIRCDGLRHRTLVAFAGLMLLVYPLGIPAFFTFLLFRHRRVLLNEALRENAFNIKLFSDLWKPYKPSRFYYEVIECVRRLVLITVSIAMDADSAAQVAITIMLAVVFALISEGLAPYESQLDAWICRLGHAVVILSMYFALLLKVNISNDSQVSQRVFEIALIVTNIFMVLTAIAEAMLTGYSMSNEQVEHRWPRPNRYHSRRFRTLSRSMVRTLPMDHPSLSSTRSDRNPKRWRSR